MQIDLSDTKVQFGIIILIAAALLGFIYFKKPVSKPPVSTSSSNIPKNTRSSNTTPPGSTSTPPGNTRPPYAPPPHIPPPDIPPPHIPPGNTSLSIPSSDIKSCNTNNSSDFKCGANCDIICDNNKYCYNNKCIEFPDLSSDYVEIKCDIPSDAPLKKSNSNLYGEYRHKLDYKDKYVIVTFYPQTNTFIYKSERNNISCGKYILNEITNVGEMIFTGGVMAGAYPGKLNFAYDSVNDRIYNFVNLGSGGIYSKNV